MGIGGLLPYVRAATRTANVDEFAGCVAAVDTYCWLHRGAFGCAEELARGGATATDAYIVYCLRLAEMLRARGVTALLVFDGAPLPSKAETERERRAARAKHRALATEHARAGRDRQARQCLQRCVDVTPEMARRLIVAARARRFDCIVAPYEADAQLAYLAQRGIAQLVITEDSDLIVFGCERVLYKMDASGCGQLVEASRLPHVLGAAVDKFSQEKLRIVCILSGCDYLASLPGVGLNRASRLFVSASGVHGWRQIVSRLPMYLGMSRLHVPADYHDKFERALNTFLYQLVFDPLRRRVVPLREYPVGVTSADLPYAGAALDDTTGLQMALGNWDAASRTLVDNFDPDSRLDGGGESVWSRHYVLIPRTLGALSVKAQRRTSTTAGCQKSLPLHPALRRSVDSATRQSNPVVTSTAGSVASLSPERLMAVHGSTPRADGGLEQSSTSRQEDHDTAAYSENTVTSPVLGSSSATLYGSGSERKRTSSRRNPFRVRGPLRKRICTSLASDAVVQNGVSPAGDGVVSKYFAKPSGKDDASSFDQSTRRSCKASPGTDSRVADSLEQILLSRSHQREAKSVVSSERQWQHSNTSSPPFPDVSTEKSQSDVTQDCRPNWFRLSSVLGGRDAVVQGKSDAGESNDSGRGDALSRDISDVGGGNMESANYGVNPGDSSGEERDHFVVKCGSSTVHSSVIGGPGRLSPPLSKKCGRTSQLQVLTDSPQSQGLTDSPQSQGLTDSSPPPALTVSRQVHTTVREARRNCLHKAVSARRTSSTSSCRKMGLSRPRPAADTIPSSGRQMKLQQMFAYRKPCVDQLKH